MTTNKLSEGDTQPPATTPQATVAEQLAPVISTLLGAAPPIRIEFWDGSFVGPEASETSLKVASADALRRMVWAPGELGLARAFVEGEIDADGDVVEMITSLSSSDTTAASMIRTAPSLLRTARQLRLVGAAPPVPDIEYRPPRRWLPHSMRHSARRDASSVSHHYDVSNAFYRLILGPSMTYSCARFAEPDFNLEQAQAAKHDNICRKLGLDSAPGSRLLDVGCGWGSMAIHAATHYGAQVVGITISTEQARLARERVAAAGVSELVDIRLQDYRTLGNERFDAISSIGMSEHVGATNLTNYFRVLREVIRPRGRILNHAISSIGGSKLPQNSFMYRYIFPDGELIDLGVSIQAMQSAGFEIRDVESLREHYAATLREWLRLLELNWDAAVAEVGLKRVRAWRLYIAACVVGFTDAGVNIHQVVGVANDDQGNSGMPASRSV